MNNFIFICALIITSFTMQYSYAQLSSGEVFIEIPSDTAKYVYYDGELSVRGPSSIEIDRNGDVYIGSDQQILVYDNSGNYLRKVNFDERLIETITDIALSNDNKLMILTQRGTIYIIDKTVSHVSKEFIDKRIFVQTGKTLSRIFITLDNQIFVGYGYTKDKYYRIDLNTISYNEYNSNYIGIPTYTTRLGDEYKGMPLKWSNLTVAAVNYGTGLINLSLKPLGTTLTPNPSTNIVDLFSLIPNSIREKYTKLYIDEVIGTKTTQNFHIKVHASEKNVFYPGKGGVMVSSFLIIIIDRTGNLISVIDDFPRDKIINTMEYDGKRFNIGPNGRLYFLHTEGDKNNLSSCVSKVYRW